MGSFPPSRFIFPKKVNSCLGNTVRNDGGVYWSSQKSSARGRAASYRRVVNCTQAPLEVLLCTALRRWPLSAAHPLARYRKNLSSKVEKRLVLRSSRFLFLFPCCPAPSPACTSFVLPPFYNSSGGK